MLLESPGGDMDLDSLSCRNISTSSISFAAHRLGCLSHTCDVTLFFPVCDECRTPQTRQPAERSLLGRAVAKKELGPWGQTGNQVRKKQQRPVGTGTACLRVNPASPQALSAGPLGLPCHRIFSAFFWITLIH